MKTITNIIHAASAVFAVACFALSSMARAETIAFSISGGNNITNLQGLTAGYAFTVSSPIMVTNLGFFDFDGDGLIQSHVVTIWTSTGTQLAQASIPGGVGGTLTNGFRYVSIAPVTLPAGTYTIGSYQNDSFIDDDMVGHLNSSTGGSITSASGLSCVGSRSGDGTTFPSFDLFGEPDSYFGPNFQFTPAQSYAAQIQQPIDADGSSIFNVRRGVVPAKFTLTLNGVATCALPPATIVVTRTAGGSPGPVDELVYTGSADNGSNFRISNCQYIYNLSASALGLGTYQVDIKIDGQVVGSGMFQLK